MNTVRNSFKQVLDLQLGSVNENVSSVTQILDELRLDKAPSSPVDPPKPEIEEHRVVGDITGKNKEALQNPKHCPEGTKPKRPPKRPMEKSESSYRSRCNEPRRSFPPPISCLDRNGRPLYYFKHIRESGRLVIQMVNIPRRESVHACEDGRLRMCLIPTNQEEETAPKQETEQGGQEEDQDEGKTVNRVITNATN